MGGGAPHQRMWSIFKSTDRRPVWQTVLTPHISPCESTSTWNNQGAAASCNANIVLANHEVEKQTCLRQPAVMFSCTSNSYHSGIDAACLKSLCNSPKSRPESPSTTPIQTEGQTRETVPLQPLSRKGDGWPDPNAQQGGGGTHCRHIHIRTQTHNYGENAPLDHRPTTRGGWVGQRRELAENKTPQHSGTIPRRQSPVSKLRLLPTTLHNTTHLALHVRRGRLVRRPPRPIWELRGLSASSPMPKPLQLSAHAHSRSQEKRTRLDTWSIQSVDRGLLGPPGWRGQP